MAAKRILFFDVDGTLVKSVYHGTDSPLVRAISQVFGRKISKEGITFSGGTAMGLTKALLDANKIEYKDNPNVKEIAPTFQQIMAKSLETKELEYVALPGVKELLEKCAKSDELELALVTGNTSDIAEIKLKSAGIDADLFKRNIGGKRKLMGGFGEDDIHRPGMVVAAMKRFSKIEGKTLDPSTFLVIGDTPKDIWCAHENNVPAIAVATGIFNVDSLKSVADCTLEDFADVDLSLKCLKNTQRIPRSSYNYDIEADSTGEPI